MYLVLGGRGRLLPSTSPTRPTHTWEEVSASDILKQHIPRSLLASIFFLKGGKWVFCCLTDDVYMIFFGKSRTLLPAITVGLVSRSLHAGD